MTLHFDWLHAPRCMAGAHVNRAMALMLGVIGVSLLFGALRVLDVAFSDTLVIPQAKAHPMAQAPVASAPDVRIGTDPVTAVARPVDVDEMVPEASVEAISL